MPLFSGLVVLAAFSAVTVEDDAGRAPVAFAAEVVPILTKLGCNGGTCHGKASGQNGFRLSLLGFDPALDHDSLTRDARGGGSSPPRRRPA